MNGRCLKKENCAGTMTLVQHHLWFERVCSPCSAGHLVFKSSSGTNTTKKIFSEASLAGKQNREKKKKKKSRETLVGCWQKDLHGFLEEIHQDRWLLNSEWERTCVTSTSLFCYLTQSILRNFPHIYSGKLFWLKVIFASLSVSSTHLFSITPLTCC